MPDPPKPYLPSSPIQLTRSPASITTSHLPPVWWERRCCRPADRSRGRPQTLPSTRRNQDPVLALDLESEAIDTSTGLGLILDVGDELLVAARGDRASGSILVGSMDAIERYCGSLLGLAAGDALGTTL